MPVHSPTPLSRRRFVAVTAGLAGLFVTGGCTLPEATPEDDPLERLARAAARDARELAAADASHGSDAARLRRVGGVRGTHSDRLAAEVDRRNTNPAGGPGPGPDDDATPICPPIDEVRTRLRNDAADAAEVAAESEGYRAELATAVSAACTAALEVVLA